MYISLINKYKPVTLDDINISTNTKKIIDLYIKNNRMLFFINGNSGSGKTSLINVILNKYYEDNREIKNNVIIINLLKEQGINYYRKELKNFCQINNFASFKKKKTIIFDDLDLLNEQCQQIFNSYINSYEHINFIISCSDTQKIKSTIIDKLEFIKINTITNDYLFKILENIIIKENIKIEKEDYNNIVTSCNYSISNMIYSIEKIKLLNYNNKDSKYDLNNIINNILINDFKEYINYCKENNINDAINKIINLYNNGYSVIDILYYFFIYIKNYADLGEVFKYKIIKNICIYINNFHNIHEDSIELYFLTNKICNTFHSN
tara:strand:+ start:376 stop:1341 length:966 start_codon:yes stop_codon:yes gene_type:complete